MRYVALLGEHGNGVKMTTHKALPNDLIDGLLANYKKPEDLIGENGLLKQLTKALVERALQAEMSEHLGHDKHEPVTNSSGNARNDKSRKHSRVNLANFQLKFPVTVKEVLSHN
jgi:putative transposase